MKSNVAKILIPLLTATLATTALAQGRHDEKPHGQQKSAKTIKEGGANTPTMSGGRHDEKPHGTQKPAAKKEPAAKKTEGTQKKE